ncbi:MAG: hypothetical protein HY906_09795, partial [Deltaproteobacteria bacterium]|nr:hypothetical protein [Deltaproteobacteria bacterium]
MSDRPDKPADPERTDLIERGDADDVTGKRTADEKPPADEKQSAADREKARREAIARVLADDEREGSRDEKRSRQAAGPDEDEAAEKPGRRGRGRLAEALGIEADERPPSKWRRRFVYLLILGVTALVVWILSVRNHDRFYLVCLPDRIEPQRGSQWPWGRDPLGGEVHAAIKVPAEVDCRERLFAGQEALDQALADLLMARIEADVKAGNPKLDEVAARVTQAQLLTRGRPEPRARLQVLAADLSYLRGRQGVEQAAATLKAAIGHLKEAKLRGAATARDADLWIEHLERLIPRLASPRETGAPPASGPAPAP